MATTRVRPLPIVLDRDDFRRLDELARDQERDPVQQARYMLRCALRDSSESKNQYHEAVRT